MYISYVAACRDIQVEYLAIIPRARIGSESIAHEAEGTPRPKLPCPPTQPPSLPPQDKKMLFFNSTLVLVSLHPGSWVSA